MNRSPSIGTILAALFLSALHATAAMADPARKPNIIVIVGDDMGYADIGVQGCKDIPTPHIDALAKGGVRFTSGYVSGPYCSPTRAGLMTGRYQQRFGHEFNPGPPAQANIEIGLSLDEVTIADHLKAAGYATGMVGKWHLGHADKFNPVNRGFQDYFGFLGGAHAYFPGNAGKNSGGIVRGTNAVQEKEYLTDAFAREAVAYIERHQKEPFFLYLTFNAVHTPLEAAEKYLKRFESIGDNQRRTYAAMMSAMDDGIGAVMAKLRESKLEENTLIFFVSDNGGPAVNGSRNGSLHGHKASTWEGGVRVPFLAQWKGRLPAGKTYDHPVIQLDILPTALAAAGLEVTHKKKIDGVNLLPHLDGSNAKPAHEALYWRFGPQMAIRMGDWKLVKAGGGDAAARQLFNLAADIGESKDLAAEQPERVKELAAAWEAWNKELIEPTWKGQKPAAKAKKKAK